MSTNAHITVREPGLITRTETRLVQIAEWMASGATPRKAAARARDELGLSRRQADSYVSAVLRRLAQDAAMEPVESKRARVVAMLTDSIEQAKAKRKQWFEDGNGDRCEACGKLAGEWISEPDPDHKAVASLTASLVTVEGLANVQSQANVIAQAEVERTLRAIRSRCTAEEWAPIDRAINAIRAEQAQRGLEG